MEDIKAIRVRKYNFKEETGHETFTQLGVIAQEIELYRLVWLLNRLISMCHVTIFERLLSRSASPCFT